MESREDDGESDYPTDELEILGHCAKRKRNTAWPRFECALRPTIRRWACSYLARYGLAQAANVSDVEQAAILSVYASLETFNELSTYATWVYSITSNRCIDLIRKTAIHPEVPLDEVNENTLCADAPSQNDTVARVREAIGQLSPLNRCLIEMHYFERMSRPDMAKALGWSGNQLRYRLGVAIHEFRAKYIALHPDL